MLPEWSSEESTWSSQDLQSAIFHAKNEVQRLFNQIQYDRTLTPGQLSQKHRLLSEAETDLYHLQNTPTNG